MTVAFFMGQVSGDPWTSLDGRLNAPSGTPQYPSLLNGYPTASPPNARVRNGGTQPPWMAAGVDYAVGPRSTPTLDPTTNPPAGCSYASGILTVNQNGVTISGYDFSLHGGVQINCGVSGQAYNDLVIEDCNFGGASYTSVSTGPIDFRGQNLTIKYCTIDGASTGANTQTQSTLISLGTGFAGSLVFQYNWCKNMCQHVFEIVSSSGNSFTIDYRYNLIDDTLVSGYNTASPAHLNYLQFTSGTCTSCLVEFNTTRQVSASGTAGGGEGFQFYFNTSGTLDSPLFAYNTMIANNANAMSNMVHAGTGPTGSPLSKQNYFDPSGAFHCFYPSSMTGWTQTGNTNMLNGTTVNDGTTP